MSTHMSFDLHIEFSEIRSLMQLPVLDSEQRRSLWETIVQMASLHPDVYASEWVPYLRAFSHHWEAPLFSTFSTRQRHLPQIEAWCALVPFACFNLNISSRASPQDLRALLTSTIFTQINALTLHHTPVPHSLLTELSNLHASTRLTQLHLEDVSLHDHELDALLGLPHSRPLTRLILPHNWLTSDSSALIASHPTLQLEALDLAHNHLKGDALKMLHEAPLSHLEVAQPRP